MHPHFTQYNFCHAFLTMVIISFFLFQIMFTACAAWNEGRTKPHWRLKNLSINCVRWIRIHRRKLDFIHLQNGTISARTCTAINTRLAFEWSMNLWYSTEKYVFKQSLMQIWSRINRSQWICTVFNHLFFTLLYNNYLFKMNQTGWERYNFDIFTSFLSIIFNIHIYLFADLFQVCLTLVFFRTHLHKMQFIQMHFCRKLYKAGNFQNNTSNWLRCANYVSLPMYMRECKKRRRKIPH